MPGPEEVCRLGFLGRAGTCSLLAIRGANGCRQLPESSARLAMGSLLTLIVTIWLDASEDVSGKAYFMNGPLFISKPHCCSDLSIAFYAMGTGSTSESSAEDTPHEIYQSMCNCHFQHNRDTVVPLLLKTYGGYFEQTLGQVMVPLGRAGIRKGKWYPGGGRNSVGGMGNIYC